MNAAWYKSHQEIYSEHGGERRLGDDGDERRGLLVVLLGFYRRRVIRPLARITRRVQ